MENKPRKILDRLLDLGVDVTKLTIYLNKNAIGKIISKQILRAGTSVGVNYKETYSAESRSEFIHNLQIIGCIN